MSKNSRHQQSNAQDVYAFPSETQDKLFKKLTRELRCSVCQNQSLAESTAPIAINLKDKIYQKISEGNSEENIIAFVTERYGEFVLYKPPLHWQTAPLWFGPFLILLISAIAIRHYFKRSPK